MNIFISAKKLAEMTFLLLVLLTLPFFLIACGPKHMITQDVRPPLVAKSDKALLVIVRTMGFYAKRAVFDNYLDKIMIGQTQGKSYFITDVAPGEHYVMGHAENWSSARINFEAGRIYILHQLIFPGAWTIRTGFSPMTAEVGLEQIYESGCDYFVYDTNNPGEDMSEDNYQKAKEDFENEVKEDPGRHKNTLEYRGYNKL
jgi:hypothetical protein